jgi:hypothetical protein
MSIETLIAENTAALIANTAALLGAKPAKAAKAAKTEEAGPVVSAATPAAASPVIVAQPLAPPAASPIARKTVSDAIVKLANEHGREYAVEILKQYKTAVVSELDPGVFQEVLNKVVAAEIAATAAKSNASLI